jgi:glycosyltransferase involved in cell wall biosynthesis
MELRSKKRLAAIYMDDWQCAPNSGGHLRLRSNVTAFHDLGWQVEVVRIENTPAPVPGWAAALGVDWVSEATAPAAGQVAGVLGRIQYRLGIPGQAACGYYFPRHNAVREAVARRQGQGRLHVLEGIQLANALPFLGDEAVIFSHYDIWHEASTAALAVQLEMEVRDLRKAEERELRFLRNMEARICRKSLQILTISARDCAVLQREGWTQAGYLPMSIDEIDPFERTTEADAPLRILHLGKISHLPSYRSLEHLLRDVFPLLEPETLNRLRLRVVGTIDEGNPRAERILQLRERYAAQVELAGFVPDLRAEFTGNDLQIVASTAASGLQTRIVESLARGLPVLASETAAQGLENLRSGESLLIARTAQEFANAIADLVVNRFRIKELSRGGRKFYEQGHSRKRVAERLQSHLSRIWV